MNGKLFGIDEILAKEDIVLFDTSTISTGRGNIVQDSSISYFSELDLNRELIQIDELNSFLEFLRSPNITTIKEVSEEIKAARNQKALFIKFLQRNGRCKFPPQKDRRINELRGNRIRKQYLEEIRDLYHKIYLESKRLAHSHNGDRRYAFIETNTLRISEEYGCKVSKNWFSFKAGEKTGKDLHTDEKLSAEGIYHAFCERQNVGLLTRDGDIERIVKNSLRSCNLGTYAHEDYGLRIYFLQEPNEFMETLNTTNLN